MASSCSPFTGTCRAGAASHVAPTSTLRPRQPNGERGLVPLDKRRLPTGPVSLSDVVAMLIEEFGAEPLVADWRERLDAAALG